jgi:hypothetical protein
MTFFYTAREIFDESSEAWKFYINSSKLTHLTELVSVDTCLNEILVTPDRHSDEDWKDIVVADSGHDTGFFKTPEFVLSRMDKQDIFNYLVVVINPEKSCDTLEITNYEFLGYDLLDQYYDISALSNCGGFDETFLPADLNNFGLISNYEKAVDIGKRLYDNNPGEDHANTNMIAIWRHRIIGRPV